MRNFRTFCLFSALFISAFALAEEAYVFPTPFSQAKCRWESTANRTLHMYLGPRSPGFEVDNAMDCAHGIRALALIVQGRYDKFTTFDGIIEFKNADGKVTKCKTITRQMIAVDNFDPLLEYSGHSRGRTATVEELRSLAPHLDQFIQVICNITDDVS